LQLLERLQLLISSHIMKTKNPLQFRQLMRAEHSTLIKNSNAGLSRQILQPVWSTTKESVQMHISN